MEQKECEHGESELSSGEDEELIALAISLLRPRSVKFRSLRSLEFCFA